MTSGIYKITISDYFYIGYSKDLKYRKATHLNLVSKNKHFNKHVQSAYNKYKTFNFEIIEKCSQELLVDREKFWIESCGFPNNTNLLNILEGGIKAPNLSGKDSYWYGKVGPTKGCKRPEVAERSRGNKWSVGKKHSDETRQKRSRKHLKFDTQSTFFKSPTNEKVCLGSFVSFREFCSINSLDRSSMSRIIKGFYNNKRCLSYK